MISTNMTSTVCRTLMPIVALTAFAVAASVHAERAVAPHAMVATVQPVATDAAVQVMRDGGNAVDAAVAAALMLGVVDNHNSGLGGGCLILIRMADGQLAAIDGREMAPQAARRDMYLRDGNAQTGWSQDGPLAVAVPGALAAYVDAIDRFGSKSLAELITPAADVAEQGFAVDRTYANRLQGAARQLRRVSGSDVPMLKPDGSPYREGETLRQPDLASSYRAIAEHGPDWFYRGPYAERVAQWMRENGGVVTEQDFARYEARRRQPIVSRYRGYSIVGFPPPSSGGVHVAQVLNILENFDIRALHDESPHQAVHVVAEAMKLAFADRAYWLGDSDFAKVPRGLLDEAYAKDLANRIDPEHATQVAGHGAPPDAASNLFGGHTTHMTAVDPEGNWVAITATVNTAFGSKVIVPGTGIPLNNEMDDFSIEPGVPNAFGLIGAENNAVEPGKRPLSCMSPTIVLGDDDQPVLTVGAAGGPRIISQVILTILRHLDLGMPLAEAVAAPRFHHQWVPDVVSMEASSPASLGPALIERGHRVEQLSSSGVTQAIGRSADGRLIGVHDPRIPGKAAGF
jgi:gamma-glutamyltranspeptidase/glutathione hydrolase